MENFNDIDTGIGGRCPEILWKDRKPYIKTLEELSLIAGDMFVINDINEVWLRGEDKVTIYLSFKFKDRSHNIWLHRRGDYLDFRLLYFLNKILRRDYRFELLYTHSEPRVYFINEEEKVSLEDRLKIRFYTFEKDPLMAFGAVVGSTAFFITHGFKENARQAEEQLVEKKGTSLSDASKILYLEVIDATFSIDGVVGAFAFTLSVPLILLGNGIGALVVRQMTISNIDRIKRYLFLKNGAMYSIFFLGAIMLGDSFGLHIPAWLSPLVTAVIVGYFFLKSKKALV